MSAGVTVMLFCMSLICCMSTAVISGIHLASQQSVSAFSCRCNRIWQEPHTARQLTRPIRLLSDGVAAPASAWLSTVIDGDCIIHHTVRMCKWCGNYSCHRVYRWFKGTVVLRDVYLTVQLQHRCTWDRCKSDTLCHYMRVVLSE